METAHTRHGMVRKAEPPEQQRRRYRIHAKLKRDGHLVKAKTRTIVLQKNASAKVIAWVKELNRYGYAIQIQPLM